MSALPEENDGKTQLNVSLNTTTVRDLKIEAIQMGMKISTYVELILDRRKTLLRDMEKE
jgi:hypothetical protein